MAAIPHDQRRRLADLISLLVGASPAGWAVCESARPPEVPGMDLDASIWQLVSGERVLVLPGSDSWVDWVWNLLPGSYVPFTNGGAWRWAFVNEALALSGWARLQQPVDHIVGFSRGAAVGYVLAALQPHVLRGDGSLLVLAGLPKVCRGDVCDRPRGTSVEFRGTWDLVARAPVTGWLGWRTPVDHVVRLAGTRHSARAYVEAVWRWAREG